LWTAGIAFTDEGSGPVIGNPSPAAVFSPHQTLNAKPVLVLIKLISYTSSNRSYFSLTASERKLIFAAYLAAIWAKKQSFVWRKVLWFFI
jgi:hypothetical protein